MHDVTLHIGLPKTGSTWLQHHVFPALKRVRYIGTIDQPFPGIARKKVRHAFWGSPDVWKQHHPQLLEALLSRSSSESTQAHDLLLSEEKIVTPKIFVPEHGHIRPSPEHLGTQLQALQASMTAAGYGRLRVVAIFRRQDTWFASRYVQSSNRIVGANQADFVARVERILGTHYDEHGAYGDYARMYRYLVDALGADNVLMLPYELLLTDQPAYLRHWFAFLGEAESDHASLGQSSATANVRRLAEDQWELRPARRSIAVRPDRLRKIFGLPRQIPISRNCNAASITLDGPLSRRILSAYASSNRELAAVTGLPLAEFGYFPEISKS